MSIGNDPNPDDLFCPACGANIDGHIGLEMDDNVYLHRTVTLYKTVCGAIVQDGEWLSRAEAQEEFGD